MHIISRYQHGASCTRIHLYQIHGPVLAPHSVEHVFSFDMSRRDALMVDSTVRLLQNRCSVAAARQWLSILALESSPGSASASQCTPA